MIKAKLEKLKKETKDAKELIAEEDFLESALENTEDWMEEETLEGQLAVDVYQTKDNIIIKAPIAGVEPDQIDVTIVDDTVTIRGKREEQKEVEREHYFAQECYWGEFSRSIVLPVSIIGDKAEATFKDGILEIKIPKADSVRVKKVKVQKK